MVTAHSRSADIDGGASGEAVWIVRGDVEGEYPLRAVYDAVLEPFGVPVQLVARSVEPLKVWGASALAFKTVQDDHAYKGSPYTVRVGLENVSDVPVYNASVELLPGGVNYVPLPTQPTVQTAAEIAPGATFLGHVRRRFRPSAGPSTSAGRSSRVPRGRATATRPRARPPPRRRARGRS